MGILTSRCHGPNVGEVHTGTFRAGGVADTNASRTDRRCTPNRTAKARTPNPSFRLALRIRSSSSTHDISFSLARRHQQPRK